MPFKVVSFNDFQILCLNGQQKLLSFGEYTQKPNSNKTNRKKLIYYTYKNKMASKL